MASDSSLTRTTVVPTFLPDDWQLKVSNGSDQVYELVTVDSSSREFRQVSSKFTSSCFRFQLNVSKIERVENPFLWGSYMLRKEEIEKSQGRAEEEELFHATDTSNVPSICTNNFDWRLHGTSRGNKHGQGVSFSNSATFANMFSSSYVMFLCKVIVNDTCIGSPSMVLPTGWPKCDSSERPDKLVVVKYRDDEFYPAYLIHYD